MLYFVVIINSIDVLELVLWYFSDVDCVDYCGIMFVFLVVEYGFVDNLVFLVRKGVKVNWKINLIIVMFKKDVKIVF